MFAQPDSWQELNPAQDNGYIPVFPAGGIFYSENLNKVFILDPISYYLDDGSEALVMSHFLTGFDGTNWEPLIETEDLQWGSVEYAIDFEDGFAFVRRGDSVIAPQEYTVSYYDGASIVDLGTFEIASPIMSFNVYNNSLYLMGFFGLGEEQAFNIITYSSDLASWSDAFETLPEITSGWANALIRYQEKWYIGGKFNESAQEDNLFVLDGSEWSQVVNENNHQLRGTIYEMHLYDGKLALAIERNGGDYNLDLGIGAGVVFWDGQNWTGPQTLIGGLGTSDLIAVRDIVINGNDLYALGTIFESEGVLFNYLAKWNGSQWCGMQTSEWGVGLLKMAIFQNRIIQAGFDWGTDNMVYWHDGETFSPCTTPLSVEEVSTADLVIYPNPIQGGMLNIETDQRIDHILLFDVQGRTVLSVKPTSNSLDLSNLAQGYYAMAVYFDGEEFPVVRAVVK